MTTILVCKCGDCKHWEVIHRDGEAVFVYAAAKPKWNFFSSTTLTRMEKIHRQRVGRGWKLLQKCYNVYKEKIRVLCSNCHNAITSYGACPMQPMDRDTFRNAVLERDHHKCVICGMGNVDGVSLDAHHIIERRLWDNGGYFLDNGATLCDERRIDIGCHMRAEQTVLSCDEIRAAAGIKRVIIPEHLYDEYTYDKWSNIIHADGTRTRGELFNDESVQKVLKAGGILSLFRKYIKYPRTYHLPWSKGLTDDDRVLPSISVFEGREVVVTEKMDGENTTMYNDHIHARSLDTDNHESRAWVKNLHGKICYDIPDGFRICGENVYALHSIPYSDLPSYFLVFSIWDQNNTCLSWDDTVTYAGVLGLDTVPVIWRGIWNEEYIRSLAPTNTNQHEGYTVRVADSFAYGSFRRSIAKWVRPHHVQTTHGWKTRAVVKNGLR